MNGLGIIQEWLLEKGYSSERCEGEGIHQCVLAREGTKNIMASHKPGLGLVIDEEEVRIFVAQWEGQPVAYVRGGKVRVRFSGKQPDFIYFSDPDFFAKLFDSIFLDKDKSIGF